MLKVEPLTCVEVQSYSEGTGAKIDKINYTNSSFFDDNPLDKEDNEVILG